MQYAGYILIYVFICSILAFTGNILLTDSIAQNTDSMTQSWLDFTSLVTDVSAFVIIGFVGYIATKVNGWIKNNKEWKVSIEKNFEKQDSRMQVIENETKNNIQKISTAVELLINNFDQYKDMQNRELTEIANDYDALSTVVTENRVEIKNLKDDMRDLKRNK